MILPMDRDLVTALLLSQLFVTVAWCLSRRAGLFDDPRWALAFQLFPAAVSLVTFAVYHDDYLSYVVAAEDDFGFFGFHEQSPVALSFYLLHLWGLILCVAFVVLQWMLSPGSSGGRSLKYPVQKLSKWQRPPDYSSTQGILRYHER